MHDGPMAIDKLAPDDEPAIPLFWSTLRRLAGFVPGPQPLFIACLPAFAHSPGRQHIGRRTHAVAEEIAVTCYVVFSKFLVQRSQPTQRSNLLPAWGRQ